MPSFLTRNGIATSDQQPANVGCVVSGVHQSIQLTKFDCQERRSVLRALLRTPHADFFKRAAFLPFLNSGKRSVDEAFLVNL